MPSIYVISGSILAGIMILVGFLLYSKKKCILDLSDQGYTYKQSNPKVVTCTFTTLTENVPHKGKLMTLRSRGNKLTLFLDNGKLMGKTKVNDVEQRFQVLKECLSSFKLEFNLVTNKIKASSNTDQGDYLSSFTGDLKFTFGPLKAFTLVEVTADGDKLKLGALPQKE